MKILTDGGLEGFYGPHDQNVVDEVVKVKSLTTDEIGPKLDPTRLEPRKGGQKGKKAHFYFVPQGATLTEEESVTVDETAVQGQSRSAAPAPKKTNKAAAPPGVNSCRSAACRVIDCDVPSIP